MWKGDVVERSFEEVRGEEGGILLPVREKPPVGGELRMGGPGGSGDGVDRRLRDYRVRWGWRVDVVSLLLSDQAKRSCSFDKLRVSAGVCH